MKDSPPRASPALTTSSSAAAVFERGDEAFKRGQWKAALQAFVGVVESCPWHLKARFRIADAVLNIGRRDLALSVYRAISWHSTKAGYPLMGMVAAKMVTLLDPSADDVLVILAELYSNESDRVDPVYGGPPLVGLGEHSASSVVEPEGDALLEHACRTACRGDGNFQYPKQLPPIPLFSYLDEESFIAVVGKLRLRRFADEEVIIRQDERGDSFFMIADGSVLMKRDLDDEDGGVTLAHLHRGSVCGELALISDEPRHASVVARGDVDVLELRRSDLVVASAQLGGISKGLKLFTRERFLRNLTATHAFFQGLSREERHWVMERFCVVTAKAGDVLIEEGRRGPGLFMMLGGAASVAKRHGSRDCERIHLATLRGGDLCGEMSMINDAPTSATVTADTDLDTLFLSREEFKNVVADHPALLKYLSGLTDERLRQNRALLYTRGLLEDDEHVMI